MILRAVLRFIPVLILFVCVLSFKSHASSIVPPENLGAMVSKSEYVILGRAVGQETISRGMMIITRTRFEIVEVVKGLPSSSIIVVDTHGGQSGEIGFIVTGSPDFAIDEVYLLFLDRGKDAAFKPSLLSYGLLQLNGSLRDGVLHPLDESFQLDMIPRKDGRFVESIDTYNASSLLVHLRQVGNGTSWNADLVRSDVFKKADDYLGDITESIPLGCVFVSYQGNPVRWNRFDQGSGVTFFVPPASTNLQVNSVVAGISTWSNLEDLSTNGKLVYGGTRSFTPDCGAASGSAVEALLLDDPGFFEGQGMIQFNDPCSEIGDLTLDGGVLAIGGTFFYLQTHSYNGVAWRTSALAFVLVNNGTEAYLGTVQYHQMMAHELGHTLGYGHHTSQPALMNAFCCNPLSDIDVNCAAFAYSELPPNDPPVIANQIQPITLTFPGSPVTRSLTVPTPFFTDPDGDPLTYSVLSENEEVVFAEMVSQTSFRLYSNSVGVANLLVRAADPRGSFVTMSVAITVEQRENTLPVVIREATPVQLNEDQFTSIEMMGTEPFFKDDDGDPLQISATSADSLVASATVDGSKVRILGTGSGSTQIVVTASDGFGGEAQLPISVSVDGKPVLIADLEPLEIVATGNPFVRNLNNPILFQDPEDGSLSYAVQNNASIYVDAQINGSILTIKPVAVGQAKLTIIATDLAGNSAQTVWNVTVQPRANVEPIVANVPSVLQLRAEDVDYVRDFEDDPILFFDADGDSLTYQAVTSQSKVATAEMDGSTIRIRPLTMGSATITVFASDAFGGFVLTSIPVTVGVPVNIETDMDLPVEFKTGLAYPNPFNPSTVIPIEMPVAGTVEMIVYDVMGRRVQSNEISGLSAGRHSVNLNMDQQTSGVYIVEIRFSGKIDRQRITLIR